MKILALEFSSKQRSVAVLASRLNDSPALLGELDETTDKEPRTLGLIEEVLKLAGVEREQIECLAVGLGPGSYTGIRSAIALAQGWQLARGIKLLGISSVECLAARAQGQGLVGNINIVIDAQRNEFYLAGYEITDSMRRESTSLRLATLDEVRSRLTAGELLMGPEIKRWFAAGQEVYPSAAMLGRLTAERDDFVFGEQLKPIYLRETSFVKAPPPRIIV